MSRIDAALNAARAQLDRPGPLAARDAQASGAVIVDTRPIAQRREHGQVPGAVVIERNVLEWRCDPTSPDRHPAFTDPDTQVIVMCQEGYASSLAAVSLQALGLSRATDLDGGFRAWAEAGLPVTPADAGRA